jgi:hypothetical protein
MNPQLKFYLEEISNNSSLINTELMDLAKEKLTSPAFSFLQTETGKDFFKRIQKKLLEKATGLDNRPTPLNLDFSTSEEAKKVLEYKDEITTFLKDEVKLEISQWYQNMAPGDNSTFVILECI